MVHLKIFFGQYASQKLLPNQILSYFDVISYCEKKLGTHVSIFFDGVSSFLLHAETEMYIFKKGQFLGKNTDIPHS